MLFIPPKNIKEFYNDIKKEYNSKSYNKFYKYLNKFLFHEIGGKKYLWNFYKLIEDNNIPEGQYFLTNNFLERTKRTLNENLIYKKSSISNFKNSIIDIDIYFSNKNAYNLNNPSLLKSIIYYIKNCNKTKKVKLINLHKIKEIYATYGNNKK